MGNLLQRPAFSSAKTPTLHVDEKQVAKTVHFIRHAQATSNKAAAESSSEAYKNEEYVDAELTLIGIEQCDALRHTISSTAYSSIQLVAVSPLRRALQTATLGLDKYLDKVPWIALECLRETTGSHPCDRRQNRSVTAASFPHVNFDEIRDEADPLYFLYETSREPKDDVVNRGKAFFAWLSKRPESVVAVVSHSSYFDHMFTFLLETDPSHCVRLANCEIRTFVILLEIE
jgi:broad specificity phosphatase PhoE